MAGDVEHHAAPLQAGIVVDVEGGQAVAVHELAQRGQAVAEALGVGRGNHGALRVEPQAVAVRPEAVGRRRGAQHDGPARSGVRPAHVETQSAGSRTHGCRYVVGQLKHKGSGRRRAEAHGRRAHHALRLGQQAQVVARRGAEQGREGQGKEQCTFHRRKELSLSADKDTKTPTTRHTLGVRNAKTAGGTKDAGHFVAATLPDTPRPAITHAGSPPGKTSVVPVPTKYYDRKSYRSDRNSCRSTCKNGRSTCFSRKRRRAERTRSGDYA